MITLNSSSSQDDFTPIDGSFFAELNNMGSWVTNYLFISYNESNWGRQADNITWKGIRDDYFWTIVDSRLFPHQFFYAELIDHGVHVSKNIHS